MKKVKLDGGCICHAEDQDKKLYCPLQQENISCGDWCAWFGKEVTTGITLVFCKATLIAEMVEDNHETQS